MKLLQMCLQATLIFGKWGFTFQTADGELIKCTFEVLK